MSRLVVATQGQPYGGCRPPFIHSIDPGGGSCGVLESGQAEEDLHEAPFSAEYKKKA
jgi:hypothetical protein